LSAPSITIEELLQTTSRTFALSIPLLPEPLNHEITLAYLVFRIADTVEDADFLGRDQRQRGLHDLCDVLSDLDADSIEQWTRTWADKSISDNDDYNRLMRETPRVLSLVRELPASSRRIIVNHASRSATGMAAVLAEADQQGRLQLQNLQALQDYCYYVAGIVGELITELFVTGRYSPSEVATLFETAAAFGEALQLVNILKDSAADRICGRAYLPAGVPIEDVFELARQDLIEAGRYVEALRNLNAPPGFIAFCDAPLQLADATLRVVEANGPGSKVPREETMSLLQQVMARAGMVD